MLEETWNGARADRDVPLGVNVAATQFAGDDAEALARKSSFNWRE
jgi:hypothetical protein